MLTIFTEILTDINFLDWNKSTMPDFNNPAIFLIHTDSESEISSFQKSLSAQEQEKAARFRFIKDQHSYIITHALLRKLLGNFLNSEPASIEFISNEFGKPMVSHGNRKIHFNISHRCGLSTLAFSAKSEIGVDVEKIDPEFDFDLIAKAHFSDAENRFIDEGKQESGKRFFTVWTRKEALLKAIGTGIGENLDVEVFRNVNYYHPEVPLPGIQKADYYLNTFEYQDKYMITTAGSTSEKFIAVII